MSLSGFEKTLLASGGREAPSPERRAAARAAVLRAAGASVAAGAAVMTTTSTAKAAGGITLAMKIGVLGVIATIVVAGAAMLTHPPPTASPSATATATATASASATGTASATATATATASASASASAVAVAVTALPPARPAAPVVVDPLAAETRLLEAARACLAAKDVRCASARLAEHAARFPKGALTEEAAVIAARVRELEEKP